MKINQSSKNNLSQIINTLIVKGNILDSLQLFESSILSQRELIQLLKKVCLTFNNKFSTNIEPNDLQDFSDRNSLIEFFNSISIKIPRDNLQGENDAETDDLFKEIKDFHNFRINYLPLQEKFFLNLVFFQIRKKNDFKMANKVFNNNHIRNYKVNNLILLYRELFEIFSSKITTYSSISSLEKNTIEDFLNFFKLILEKINYNNFFNIELDYQINLINMFDKFDTIIKDLKNKNFNHNNEALNAFIHIKQHIIKSIENCFSSELSKKIKYFEEEINSLWVDFKECEKLSNELKQYCLQFQKLIKLLLGTENQNRLVHLGTSLIIHYFVKYEDDQKFWNNNLMVTKLLDYCIKKNHPLDDFIKILQNLIHHENKIVAVKVYNTFSQYIKIVDRQTIFEDFIYHYKQEYKAIVEKLIDDVEININPYYPWQNFTLFSRAIENGPDVAILLLKSPKFEINNHQCREDITPLMVAINASDNKIINIILKDFPRINVNAQDKKGNTALIYAVIKDDKQTTCQLMDFSNININAQNKEGQTALSLATNLKHGDIIEKIQNALMKLEDHQQSNFKPDLSPFSSGSSKKSLNI